MRATRTSVAVALVAAAACLGAAQAADGSVLEISSPASLKTAALQHSDATFGRPQFDGAITGDIVYAGLACSPLADDPKYVGAILLVDRGSCTFTGKARHAQNAGAKAVLFGDNTGLCGLGSCESTTCGTSCHHTSSCKCFMPLLADDGTGVDVRIPSFLIPKVNAAAIKACVAGTGEGECATPTTVSVSMSWNIPVALGPVAWELWGTSNDTHTSAYHAMMAPLVRPLGNSVQFNARYYIYDGAQWGCTQSNGHGGYRCGNQCTNQGRYCSPDPERDLHHGNSGSDVVKENLRQMCIWSVANQTYAADQGYKWWNYTALFDKHCARAPTLDWVGCGTHYMWVAGIDANAVNECMRASGGLANTGDNVMLAAEVASRSDLLIVRLPELTINHQLERNEVTAQSTLLELCAVMKPGSEPPVCQCKDAASASDFNRCVANNHPHLS